MSLDAIDTPAVLIDLTRAEANLARAQAYADQHGLRLRPHIKTHKLPRFAKKQMDLGAVGITAQKLGEAEAMAAAGLTDILITYNILGGAKLARLATLHQKVTVSVCADSSATIAGYATTFADPAHPLNVLVECDTGAGRCGVQRPEQALALARQIAAAPGLHFSGLMTYPPQKDLEQVDRWLITARDLMTAQGLPSPVISTGGSPALYRAHQVTAATEHRPGTYIYADRMQVAAGLCGWEDCALTVLATVVSRPTETRAVIDAGSKALSSDLYGLTGHGRLTAYPDAVITSLSEEHAVIDLAACTTRPAIGERVQIIPNHACVVTNLFNQVHLTQSGALVAIDPVTSRGAMT
jgi:D-serine deaminase-like pyridoxal phosphate-dependent protein